MISKSEEVTQQLDKILNSNLGIFRLAPIPNNNILYYKYNSTYIRP